MTSGAFYAHFKSKAAAFREAIAAGLTELRDGIGQFLQKEGENWLDPFVDFYLGARRQAALSESCALQSLSGDVARAEPAAKRLFHAKLEEVLGAMTAREIDGGPAEPDRAHAIVLLALLSGAVSMGARSMIRHFRRKSRTPPGRRQGV